MHNPAFIYTYCYSNDHCGLYLNKYNKYIYIYNMCMHIIVIVTGNFYQTVIPRDGIIDPAKWHSAIINIII